MYTCTLTVPSSWLLNEQVLKSLHKRNMIQCAYHKMVSELGIAPHPGVPYTNTSTNSTVCQQKHFHKQTPPLHSRSAVRPRSHSPAADLAA